MTENSRRVYVDAALQYIAGMATQIRITADFLGLSAGVIGGALAEEADSYYTAGFLYHVADSSLDVMTRTFGTNESLHEDYAQVIASGIIELKSKKNDILHPTMRDIGPGNIRVAVAIGLIQRYFEKYPSNPLGLNVIYRTDYLQLVKDLSFDPKNAAATPSSLAASVAGLALKEAQDYFVKNVDPAYWNSLAQETRDAIVITAYNIGLPRVEAGRQGMLRVFGVYKPAPGGTESGGLDHENNATAIGARLGVSGYGERFSYPIVEVGTSYAIQKAKENTAVGMAFRYALLNFDPLASVDRVGSGGAELDLSQFSDRYLSDRANAYQAFMSYARSGRTDHMVSPTYRPSPEIGDTVIIDMSYGQYVSTSGVVLGSKHVTFGSVHSDNITGGEKNDRLYGGAGSDTFDGGDGADYIEGNDGDDTLGGGVGDDTLIGGTGGDTYTFATGNGNDCIVEADEQDTIVIDGNVISGGKEIAAGGRSWVSADKKVKFSLLNRSEGVSDLWITYGEEDKRDTILVKNYVPGKFGITLEDIPVAPVEHVGAGGSFESTLEEYTYHDRTISYTKYQGGGAVTTNGPAAVFAGAGNNTIVGTVLNETIFAGNGHNLIIANRGHDFIQVGDGNNQIYLNGKVDLKTAIEAGKGQGDSVEPFMGALVGVGNGNNTIFGGNSGDAIVIGSGENFIVTGAGDTLIIGGERLESVFGENAIVMSKMVPLPFDAVTWGVWRSAQGVLSHNFTNVTTGDYELPEDYRGAISSTDMQPHGLGNATVIGGAGNDFYLMSNGDNYVDAGAGNDYISTGVGHNIILAGSGNDTIWGSGGSNYINAESGDDFMVLFGGNNSVFGGSGNSTIYSGHGGENWASSYKEDSNNFIDAESGNNVIFGSGGHDTIFGGSGNDTLYAGDGEEYLKGGSGNTSMIGGGGKSTLEAGSGDDTIIGGTGETTIYGGSGTGHLFGGSGNNVIYGGTGNDTIVAGSGNTTIVGGSGVAHIKGGTGVNIISAGDGGTYFRPTVLQAGSGETTLYGGTGYSQLIGGDNTSFGVVSGGHVTIFGNSSSDVIVFDEFIDPSDVDVRTTLYSDGTASVQITDGEGGTVVIQDGLTNGPGRYQFGGMTLTLADLLKKTGFGTQYQAGSGFSLTVSDTAGVLLIGGNGNDTIAGYGANDTMVGGTGKSVLIGGGGDATYVASSAAGAQTTIYGSQQTDTLQFAAGVQAWDLVSRSASGGGEGRDATTIKLGNGGEVTLNGSTDEMLREVSFADGGTTTLGDLLAQSSGGVGIATYADGSTRASSNDGLGNISVTQFDSQHVKVVTNWWQADGSHGTTTFQQDGAFVATTVLIDGSVSIRTDDTRGTMQEVSYTAQGVKVGANWTKSDGSFGTDAFGADGASSGTLHRADGSYSTYTNDGHGDIDTLEYDVNGVLIGGNSNSGDGVKRTVSDDGHGNVVITYSDAQGVKLSDRWNKADGSYGTDNFRTDGTSSGIGYRLDGSYTTYADNARGQVIAKNFSWSGQLTGSSVTETYGQHNVITSILNAVGIKVSETWIHSDGSTGSDLVGPTDMFGAASMAAMDWGQSYTDYWRTPQPDSSETPYWADVSRNNYSKSEFPDFSGFDTTMNNATASTRMYYFSESGRMFDLIFKDYQHGMEFELYQEKAAGIQLYDRNGFVSIVDSKVPLSVSQNGSDGTTSTLDLDGQGNALMVIYDGQGKKIQDMWLQNDGTYGLDLFNQDGSRAGMASSPHGRVVTYTDDGMGHVLTTGQISAPASIMLPEATVPVAAAGALGGGQWGSNGGGGQLTFIFRHPDGSVTISRGSEGALVLIVIRTDPGYDASFVIDGKKTFWSYTDGGIPISGQSDDGHGNLTTYFYNSQGHVTHYSTAAASADGTIAALIFDVAGNRIGSSTTTGTGTPLVTTTTFDMEGNVTGSTTRQTDGRGNSIDSTFDGAGNLSSMIQIVVTAENAATISFYDGQKNPTGVITTLADASGLVQTHNYDAAGKYIGSVIATPDADGNFVTANYDAQGKLTSYVLVRNNAQGEAAFSVFDANGMPVNASTLSAAGVETFKIFRADGASELITRAPDHSYTITSDDGRANVVTTSYNAQEIKLSDIWTYADGSRGADTFHADGTTSGTVIYADGSTALIGTDAQGTTTVSHYGTDGALTGLTVSTVSQGNVQTVNFSATGVKLSARWTHADGVSGSDVFNADGSSTGTTNKVDGSHSTYVNDGKGTLTITEFDRDGGETGTIVSTPNRAPTLVNLIADQNLDEGQSLSLLIGGNSFADPDSGDILSYAVALSDGSALPSWLDFSAETGILSGSPTDADTGVLNLTVSASDRAGLTSSAAFVLTVRNVNVAPVLAMPIADQIVDEAQPFNFVLPSGMFGDADRADTLSLEVSLANGQDLPNWISFDAATGTLSGTPSDADTGSLEIMVTATDAGQLAASTTFEVNVNNVNQAPVLAGSLVNLGTDEGKPFSLVVPADAFIDPDAGDSLSYTVSAPDGAPLPGWLSFDPATRRLAGTPAPADVGTLAIKLTATDAGGMSASSTFQLVVMQPPHLVFTGTAGADLLKGGVGNDELLGLEGNDQLNGGAGQDSMSGGGGNDTYFVDEIGDVVVEFAAEGTDVIKASVSHVMESNVENLILMGGAAIDATGNSVHNTITGNAAANGIVGGAGNDALNGGGGADSMAGGIGNDSYIVDSDDDVVIELAGEGADTVKSAISYTLGANVEKLVLTGTRSLNGTGNDHNNVITGNNADNLLIGGAGHDTINGNAGADTMIGGTGNDTYTVTASDDILIENAGEGSDTVKSSFDFALAANLENLTLIGTAVNGTGNAFANVLTGNAADNLLRGEAGNDVLNGVAGADTLIGGTGNDVYVVDSAADAVTEGVDEGKDTVKASVSYVLGANLENLTLSGALAIDGSGNDAHNVITGNNAQNRLAGGAGDDTLNGGAGADTLDGGTGNDSYVVDNSADVIIENPGEGVELIKTSASYALSANLENLMLTGAGHLMATGNDLENVLYGNGGNSTLIGGAGADTLRAGTGVTRMDGGLGNDLFVVAHAGDIVSEGVGEGNDSISSSVSYVLPENVETLLLSGSANLTATGNSGYGLLVANSGNTTLIGGTGINVLQGRNGNDTLIDLNGHGVLLGGGGRDTITGGAAGQFIAGGSGADLIQTGASSNVISFNKGDGVDTILASPGAHNTLSLGRGIGYANLSLSKSAEDLILNTGSGESIRLQGWYADLANHDVATLQVIEEASSSYDATSSNVLFNKKVTTFDFAKLVDQFDQALLATPTLTSWGLMNGLLNAHLNGSDTSAIGGDLAYHYGKNGSLVGMDLAAAVAPVQDLQFAENGQSVHVWSTVNQGVNPLR